LHYLSKIVYRFHKTEKEQCLALRLFITMMNMIKHLSMQNKPLRLPSGGE